MLDQLNHNLTLNYILFALTLFFSLEFLQQNSNALPFFYKDYPTYQVNGKKYFDHNSESLILNRIDFSTLDIVYPYHFNLWRANSKKSGPANQQVDTSSASDSMATPGQLKHGVPYQSQIGAQAWFWAKLAEILDIRYGNYRVLKSLSVLFVSLSAAMLLIWMKINFGTLSSLAGLCFLILSTGVNIFSQSLYWSLWLLTLPLTITCLLGILNIQNSYLIFIATLPAFLIKFLSGYEFISVIVLAAMTPYAWDFFARHNTAAASRALVVSASSICAFLLSLFYYDLLFFAELKTSGIDHLLARSQLWSIQKLEALGLAPWTQVTKILIMNFIDFNGYGIPLGACLILTLITLTMAYVKNKIRAADMGFILFLFLSSASWLLIQPGHLLFHPRYAALVFALPFGLFAVGLITRLFDTQHWLKVEK